MKFPEDTDKKRYSAEDTGGEYMDDATISPIGRLMDDGDEDEQPTGAYVSGFDRSKPPAPEPPPTPTRPAPIPGAGRERPPSREREMPPPREREVPPPRERPAPTPSLASDEDFFEIGSREARRERERRRPANPNPRPAVRATVPTQRRMSAPPKPRPADHEEIDTDNPDEVYDTFRKRYNPDELISASKGGRTVRRDARSSDARPQADEREERLNPARVAVLGGAFACLVLLIILTANMVSLRGQRNDFRTQAEENEGFRTRYHDSQLNATGWQNRYNQRTNDYNTLRAQVSAQASPATADNNHGEGNDATGTATQTPAEDFPRQHTVVPRDNLTVIARRHYGAERVDRNPLVYIAHIREYNNMRNDQVNLGQVLNIPAPPAQ